MRAPLVLVTVLATASCSAAARGAEPAPDPPSNGAEVMRAEVLEVRPHDRTAFTQGFEIADGVLYEGTGLEGESTMRATDPKTGAVTRKVDLPPEFFGEGITVVDDTIWQLTWQNGVAIRRDRATLAERERVGYTGEGWGICHDGERLVMSDGSAELTFRDPETFAETGRQEVHDDEGTPVERLNELECVDGSVYANVWLTDSIVRIDPDSGDVTATVDLAGLLPEEDGVGADVLNGIAAIPDTDEFLVTGKLWPKMFRVRFVTAQG
ncbi:glutaminyl-peptide cyclotransferase [Actinophytocola xanthii]|uniref:Glutaminyl-peptide cyclotransferase n=1 Tax=Actinophytocola xanthii TaxID=1912961 RepID=A0A1Q8CTQ2_9PSEU|nr:glutaminyl-peptide cyclotransferase [Actinophytocola xanthii]OLF17730.1 glutaminyl-peptide cyclotransferase [Actinophytocola xanthii]